MQRYQLNVVLCDDWRVEI